MKYSYGFHAACPPAPSDPTQHDSHRKTLATTAADVSAWPGQTIRRSCRLWCEGASLHCRMPSRLKTGLGQEWHKPTGRPRRSAGGWAGKCQKWTNTNPSLGSRRSTEMNGREVPKPGRHRDTREQRASAVSIIPAVQPVAGPLPNGRNPRVGETARESSSPKCTASDPACKCVRSRRGLCPCARQEHCLPRPRLGH